MDTKDLVSSYQAVLLKKAGFDRPVLYSYNDCPEGYGTKVLAPNGRKWTESDGHVIVTDLLCECNGCGENLYSAPTMEQARRWLCEEKGFDIGIQHHYWEEGIWYELSVGDRNTMDDEFIQNYKRYDMALSRGITVALERLTKTEVSDEDPDCPGSSEDSEEEE